MGAERPVDGEAVKPVRARLVVEIDLDPVPGFGHEAESWRRYVERLLIGAADHYHPAVTVEAPVVEVPR